MNAERLDGNVVPVGSDDAIDISAVIDRRPIGRFQIGIMILIGLSVVMDGFDVQAMGFVAPSVMHALGVSRSAMGPVFGTSLIGMLIGSLVLGPVADRIGRRPVLIGATAFLSLCMLATSLASTLPQLLILRFITGLGMGGIMGNAISLVSEYSPARKRVTLMMWVSCGFTGGAVFGGVVSAAVIPLWGWQAVFVSGGIVPLLVALAMLTFLPESMQFLALRGRDLHQVAFCLNKIDPSIDAYGNHRYRVHESTHQGAPVRALFASGRAATTLLLWGINFLNLLDLFFLANWLPTIATDAGYDVSSAAIAGTLLQIGGVAGTIAMGPMIDRWGFSRVLVPCYLIAALSIAAIGQSAHASFLLLLVFVTISGFGIVGGQPANNTLSATLYPTTLRATGVGWSLGIGRAGSIVGPIAAGILMELHWSSSRLFIAAAVPALLSATMLIVLSRRKLPAMIATRRE
ncbi:MFS transporter [Paraburkholderia xenovorans]|uniref:MFS transporter n=1 Tax=Paraburkholderia xenovorans TaxID=36873 RepID=UPI0038BBB04C